MSKPTFTPGPWQAIEKPHTAGPGHDYWHIIAGDGVHPESFDISGFMSPGEASLIAAAPDILEALEMFVADWSGDPSPPRKVMIARAALAKARGE